MHALQLLFGGDWPYAYSQGSVNLWLIDGLMHLCMTVPILHALHTGDSAFAFALRDVFLFNSDPGFMC